MKRRTYKLFLALLVITIIMNTACSLNSKVIEFVPNFSQDRMIETISLLSAEDGGRIAGFKGEAAAADYIVKRFNSIDLDVSKQSFPIIAFACDYLSLTLLSNNSLSHEVKVLTFSAPTPAEGITAEIVPVGMGADDDYSDKDVLGKIALIMRGGEYFLVKTDRAHSKGAVAVIFYDPNGEEALSATLTQLSAIPAVSIARTDAEKIEKTISKGNSIEASLVVDSITQDTTSKNVIGLYKSDDNPEGACVIVGAHYDGVDTPAANDNASGIAVLLEIATSLSEQKISLPYDVRFIAFGAEEIGLLGSTAYVNSLSRDEINSVIAMLNYDMVGVGESFEILTVEQFDMGQLLGSIKNVLGQMGYTPIISNTERSDHTPFSYAGIQAVDIQMSPSGYYHTDMDTIDTIQPEVLIEMCELGTKLLMDELPNWLK